MPLVNLSRSSHQDLNYTIIPADIFGTKVFPWPIRKKKIRPYVGFTASALTFRQYTNIDWGQGPAVTKLRLPLLAGINYCTGKYLVDAGICYYYDNGLNYYISQTNKAVVKTPPFYITVSLRRWLETTLSAEKEYRDGTTQKRYSSLKEQKKLSSWFVGIGPSSAFYTTASSYNTGLRAFMVKPFSTVVFPEAVAGYYYEPFGMHVVSVFRSNHVSNKAYNIEQFQRRTSLTMEVHRQLLDYHGFVPYIGLCSGYEWLYFKESVNGNLENNKKQQVFTGGFVAGWDILPDKLQGFTLRTNLRYFPILNLEASPARYVSFSQLEFNFIQLVVYPQRVLIINREIDKG